jgi:hypothetical protein
MRTSKSIGRALLFVTAWQEPTMLAAYKVYIDGALVSLGPGRGEANVLDRNSTFMLAPYNAVDVTHILKPQSVIAVEGMAPLYAKPCNLHVCKDPNTAGGGILLQLELTFTDGSTATVVTNDGSSDSRDSTPATAVVPSAWTATAADLYYNPSAAAVKTNRTGETAYAKVMENINATNEVLGWRTARDVAPTWPTAVVSPYQARGDLIARMGRFLGGFFLVRVGSFV